MGTIVYYISKLISHLERCSDMPSFLRLESHVAPAGLELDIRPRVTFFSLPNAGITGRPHFAGPNLKGSELQDILNTTSFDRFSISFSEKWGLEFPALHSAFI